MIYHSQKTDPPNFFHTFVQLLQGSLGVSPKIIEASEALDLQLKRDSISHAIPRIGLDGCFGGYVALPVHAAFLRRLPVR